ncbi:MAG: hypothetical protein ABJC36_01840 [Gemmatimonadales bacterium]
MILAALAGFGWLSAAAAQAPAAFRYTPDQWRCVSLHERSRGVLEAETGLRRRRETLSREGAWRVRGQPAPSGITIEAWYDSLALTRQSPEGTLAPDTEGLLGGRYRGTLSASGRYVATARPFVPDEVAEVSDLGAAMDELLPPLPPAALAVGERWGDSTGLLLRRLPDSTAGRRTVRRLALRARAETDRATVRGDTTAIPARQVTVEEGQVDWAVGEGFLRRTRHIVVETSVPAGGPLRAALRSRLEQDVVVERVGPGGHPAPNEGSAGTCE